MPKMKSFYEPLSYQVIGILYGVHNQLGNLLQEKYYQRAIAVALDTEKIPYEQEKAASIRFKDKKIGHYKIDFLIDNQLILETKTIDIELTNYHHQILSYMNELQIKFGLIANFRSSKLQIKRLILPEKYIQR